MLNALNLLRDGREDTLLETVELVEAAPCTDLTQSDEDAAHSLEVERFVTAEDKHKPTELNTECFNGFRLSSPGGTEGRATKLVIKGLSECQVTPVREWRLDKAVRNTEVLPAVREGSVSDTDRESV